MAEAYSNSDGEIRKAECCHTPPSTFVIPHSIGEAGFCFPEGAGGGVRGWVLLARLSALLCEAEAECEVLAGEDRGEPGAGPKGGAPVARARLEGVSDLGVSVEAAAGGECAADSQNARIRISTTEAPGIRMGDSGMRNGINLCPPRSALDPSGAARTPETVEFR